MKLSVVIPCRNEGDALAACLDALEAQDLPRSEFEILVVDGYSTDGCDATVVDRGLRLLRDPGRGPAAARNVGIAHARGGIVAFTDADCVPRFDWLSRILGVFEAEPDVGGVAGGLRLPRDTLIGRLEDNDARVRYRGYITSNVAYKRRVLKEVGGFHEALQCAEDYDLAWRVLDAGYRITHALDAIVMHRPPEVNGKLLPYLRKQFWYARNDIPAHALALQRARAARRHLHGSSRARGGLLDAARNVSWPALGSVALLARSPFLVAGAAAGAALASANQVRRTLADVGAGMAEAPQLVALETAKRVARGAGTITGVMDLARPSVARALRRAAPFAAPAPAPAIPWTAPMPA